MKPAVTAEDVRLSARQAVESLSKVKIAIQECERLLSTIPAQDATFSTRDALAHLLETLDDINPKAVVKEVHKVVKARLISRASE
jgi:uncharacterized membrane protein YcaP (DUF421 family)